jgi:hypothetical protein
MTERLRELFDEMLTDEPPLVVTVDDVVGSGRRERQQEQRRRRVVVAYAVAAVVLLVVGLVTWGSSGDGDDDGDVFTEDDSTPMMEPAPEVSDGLGPSLPSDKSTESTGSTAGTTTTSTSSPSGSTPPSTATPSGEELLTDPGFESVPPDWNDFGPSTWLDPVDTARTGAHALAVTTSAPGPDPVVAGATNTPATTRTVPGVRYTATCWARSDIPIRARVQLQEYTDDWQRAGDPTPSEPVTLADPGRWYQVSATHTATGSGNQLPLTVFTTDLFVDDAPLVVDDCSLRQT